MNPKIHLRVIFMTIYSYLALKYACEQRLRLFSHPYLCKSAQNLCNNLAFYSNYAQNVGSVYKNGPKFVFMTRSKFWSFPHCYASQNTPKTPLNSCGLKMASKSTP